MDEYKISQHDNKDTPPAYDNYEPQGGSPPWRTILSVIVLVISLIRLASTCSNNNGNNAGSSVQQDQFMQDVYQRQAMYRNAMQGNSNDLLYASYDSLENMESAKKDIYRVTRIGKDTLIGYDLETKIKINKGEYFQNNRDDSLRMAVKRPDGLTVFFHDFESKGDLKYNFLEIKRGKGIADFKVESDKPDAKSVTYTFGKNGKKWNGYAIISRSNGYFASVEFESNGRLPEIKKKALLYMIENFKH